MTDFPAPLPPAAATAPNPPAPDGHFALGSFLARWQAPRGDTAGRHDLSASESCPTPLRTLLALAGEADRRRWHDLDLGYPTPHGAAWLREAIAARHTGLVADDVLCCAGAQEAIACVARALLSAADHAILVVPIYQPSEQALAARCPVTAVPLAGAGWRLDIDRIGRAIRPETRLVLINFPNSPTGAVLDAGTLAALVALCRRHGLWLVNDEVYRAAGAPRCATPPVAECYERGITIDAVSKGFGLPGLRVGWVACRDGALLARVLLAKSALSSCLAAPSEVLAHIALQAAGPILARNRAIADANRHLLRGFLRRHADLFGDVIAADGPIAYPRYRGPGTAEDFANRMAREAGVLTLPGALWRTPLADFCDAHVRIGLGQPGMVEALAAMAAHLAPEGARRTYEAAAG